MASAFSDVEHPWSWLHRDEIKCSCCGDQVNPFNTWFRHPVLKTVQCSKCNDFYNAGQFTKDEDGYYIYCRLCGEGGTLYGCDFCIESFCKQCVLRNLGRAAITEIESGEKWHCYLCKPEKIAEPVELANRIQQSMQLHEKYLEEKAVKREQRKLQKFEKMKNEKLEAGEKSGDDSADSTDCEQIEQDILELFNKIEKAMADESKSVEKRRLFSKKVNKNVRKLGALKTQARRIIGKMEGYDSEDNIDVAEADCTEDENELELLGLKVKRRLPKKENKKATTKRPKKSPSPERIKHKKKTKLRLKKLSKKKRKKDLTSESEEENATDSEEEWSN